MELKPKFLLVIVVLVTVITLLIIGDLKSESEQAIKYESGVVNWLNAFTSQDFEACDKMICADDKKLCSEDNEYYNLALEKLIGAIKEIEITKIVETEEGLHYTIKVHYKPYKMINDLVISDLSDLVDSYINKGLSDSDFKQELERVYFEVYSASCFQQDAEAETRSMVLTLSEKKVNGVTSVYNTVSFVDSLLSGSYIENNVFYYENNIKDEVLNLIKAN